MSRPKILSGASVFLVRDVPRAADHYRDRLGFRYSRFWGDPPAFCMVWRDEQCVMLSAADDPADIRPVSSVRSAVWDAYFWVDDVRALHAEFEERGATVEGAPTLKPYGVLEFTVRDVDGYQLAFGQEVEDGSEG